MIGVFDSGSGGLSALRYIREALPQYSYVYFGDYEHCPYGERSPQEVYELTRNGVQRLFDAGCEIVILACNTAITHSIQRLQTDDFPDKKILGVTITAGEKIQELGLKKVTVLATKGTVLSRTYVDRMNISRDIHVDEIPLSGLVEIIERYFNQEEQTLEKEAKEPIQNFLRENIVSLQAKNEAIVLGCTHYSWIYAYIRELFPDQIIIDPSKESAQKLETYLSNHPEIQNKLDTSRVMHFLTSSNTSAHGSETLGS